MKQLSLFDEIEFMEFQENKVPKVQKDYLSKQDRVISLLRKKEQKKFKKNAFLELINIKKYESLDSVSSKYQYVLKRIRTCYMRSVLDGMDNDNAISHFLSMFCNGMENVMKVSLSAAGEGSYKMISSLLNKKKFNGVLKIYMDKKEINIPFGLNARLTKRQHDSVWVFRKNKEKQYYCKNAEEFFENEVFLCRLREYLLDTNDPNKIRYVLKKQKEWLQHCQKSDILKITDSAVSQNWIFDYLTKEQIPICRVSQSIFSQMDSKEQKEVITEVDFLFLFLVTKNITNLDFIVGWHNSICADNISVIKNLFIDIVDYMLADYIDEKNQQKVSKITSEYAKSWMTKKYISEKVLCFMENTSFNKYFGYVEFDNEVDLDKALEISKEWEAIAEFMNFKKRKDVQLRFRRLGHHHASGLYYPHCQCICVDIKHPDSMMHEYIHMLDDVLGDISRSDEFYDVRRTYKAAVNKIIKEDNIILTGKYDRTYYFAAAEIFARCGEIYMTDVLKVNNSLVKPEMDKQFAYPKNEELLSVIRNFFDDFFKKYFGKERVA